MSKEDAEIFTLVSIIDNKQRHAAEAVAQLVQVVSPDVVGRRHKPNLQGGVFRQLLGNFAKNSTLSEPRRPDETGKEYRLVSDAVHNL
jgi:hypothetical protein